MRRQLRLGETQPPVAASLRDANQVYRVKTSLWSVRLFV